MAYPADSSGWVEFVVQCPTELERLEGALQSLDAGTKVVSTCQDLVLQGKDGISLPVMQLELKPGMCPAESLKRRPHGTFVAVEELLSYELCGQSWRQKSRHPEGSQLEAAGPSVAFPDFWAQPILEEDVVVYVHRRSLELLNSPEGAFFGKFMVVCEMLHVYASVEPWDVLDTRYHGDIVEAAGAAYEDDQEQAYLPIRLSPDTGDGPTGVIQLYGLVEEDPNTPLLVQAVPHMPLLEARTVSHASASAWDQFGGRELESALHSGATLLVSGEWILNADALAPRQTLGRDAFMSTSALMAATSTMLNLLPIICVSHCWFQESHPDPHGHNLRLLARALWSVLTHLGGQQHQFGFFFDFCSIHQKCRGFDGQPAQHTIRWLEDQQRFADDAIGDFPIERDLFKQALNGLGVFYSHPMTAVFMLTAFPGDWHEEGKYIKHGNDRPYTERGWCFCEASWASMVGDSAWILDIGDGQWRDNVFERRTRRKPPVSPETFVAQLKCKRFTCGGTDKPLVERLYREAFHERFGLVEVLNYSRLRWGDQEAEFLIKLLNEGMVPKLRELRLYYNEFSSQAKEVLKAAWKAHKGDEGLFL